MHGRAGLETRATEGSSRDLPLSRAAGEGWPAGRGEGIGGARGPCSRPRVLLLMPTNTYRARAFLHAASRLGVDVTVGSERESVLADLAPGTTIALPFDDLERGLQEVVKFSEQYPLQAVVGVDDAGVLLAATASAALGLRNASIEAVAASRDKHRFRQALRQAGLPSPWFRLVSLGADPDALARELRYPCVLKPLSLAASRGVIRANGPEEFAAAFSRVGTIVRQAAEEGRRKVEDEILVEAYIPGVEVSLEGLIIGSELHVLALFDKPDPLEGPFFEETIYVTPSRLSEETQQAIVESARHTLRALGLRQGPLHAEMRINQEGVWPIDVASRSIGGLCSNALRFGAGDSLEELILRQAIGAAIESLEREHCPAGVMMIPIPGGGILREVRGCEEAGSLPGIEEITISIPIGQPLVPLPEGDRYLGFIFARGESPDEVEAALRRAHGLLEFVISPR